MNNPHAQTYKIIIKVPRTTVAEPNMLITKE